MPTGRGSQVDAIGMQAWLRLQRGSEQGVDLAVDQLAHVIRKDEFDRRQVSLQITDRRVLFLP